MKLHLDKTAFEMLINEASSKNGVRSEVLEKDYYVTLLLFELSRFENQGYAFFKGGTALYKAMKSIQRFSEDIDLTIQIDDCPNPSQAKKRLENSTLKFECMPKGAILENKRGSITCEYLYTSLYNFDENDTLDRYGKVKVEGTSFTISEPISEIEIAPHLYELCNDTQKRILNDLYDVKPFTIKTISMERIFIDKIFASEFYFERNEYTDVSKHVYDLTVLLQDEQIINFLKNRDRVLRIVELKRKEELIRKGGVDSNLKISDFPFLNKLFDNKTFEDDFYRMQRIYVFKRDDFISLDKVKKSILEIANIFKKIEC